MHDAPGRVWGVHVSRICQDTVAGSGMRCMIEPCRADAAGHVVVEGGPHDGRCVAVTCLHHGSAEGFGAVREMLIHWAATGLLDLETGGPGPHGEPQVWHVPPPGLPGAAGHWDAMPRAGHHG